MDDDSSVDSHGNIRNLIEYEEEDSEYSPSEDTSESAVAKRVRKNKRAAKRTGRPEEGLKEKKVKDVKQRSPKEQPKAKKAKKPLAKKKKVESEEEEEEEEEDDEM